MRHAVVLWPSSLYTPRIASLHKILARKVYCRTGAPCPLEDNVANVARARLRADELDSSDSSPGAKEDNRGGVSDRGVEHYTSVAHLHQLPAHTSPANPRAHNLLSNLLSNPVFGGRHVLPFSYSPPLLIITSRPGLAAC